MKNLEQCLVEVIEIFSKQLNKPKEQINEQDTIADLADDSIQLFELLTAFENHYQLRASYADVINLETVLDVAKYVQEKSN
jgi:acyl carrier protein